mmetsp:Transcript_86017/g.230125  ORF Transcript_86017/g.230125 Transcript_86017/m.230125 type:complete len:743 (+) Transcript_86017:3205-5433(+)
MHRDVKFGLDLVLHHAAERLELRGLRTQQDGQPHDHHRVGHHSLGVNHGPHHEPHQSRGQIHRERVENQHENAKHECVHPTHLVIAHCSTGGDKVSEVRPDNLQRAVPQQHHHDGLPQRCHVPEGEPGRLGEEVGHESLAVLGTRVDIRVVLGPDHIMQHPEYQHKGGRQKQHNELEEIDIHHQRSAHDGVDVKEHEIHQLAQWCPKPVLCPNLIWSNPCPPGLCCNLRKHRINPQHVHAVVNYGQVVLPDQVAGNLNQNLRGLHQLATLLRHRARLQQQGLSCVRGVHRGRLRRGRGRLRRQRGHLDRPPGDVRAVQVGGADHQRPVCVRLLRIEFRLFLRVLDLLRALPPAGVKPNLEGHGLAESADGRDLHRLHHVPQRRHGGHIHLLHRRLMHVAERGVAQLQVRQQQRPQQHELRGGAHQPLARIGDAIHLHHSAVAPLRRRQHGGQGEGDLSSAPRDRVPTDTHVLHRLPLRLPQAVPPPLDVQQGRPHLHDQPRPRVLILDAGVVCGEDQGHHRPVQPGLAGQHSGEDEEVGVSLGLELEWGLSPGVVHVSLDCVLENRRPGEGQPPLQDPRLILQREHNSLPVTVELPHEVPHGHGRRQVGLLGVRLADRQRDQLAGVVGGAGEGELEGLLVYELHRGVEPEVHIAVVSSDQGHGRRRLNIPLPNTDNKIGGLHHLAVEPDLQVHVDLVGRVSVQSLGIGRGLPLQDVQLNVGKLHLLPGHDGTRRCLQVVLQR